MMRWLLFGTGSLLCVFFTLLWSNAGCTPAFSGTDKGSAPGGPVANTAKGVVPSLPAMPAQARAGAGSQFWKHWGDGNAELSGYKGVTPRYGRLVKAEVVLVYVTETLHRDTLIKDDSATGRQKISALKLNHILKFRTGIYPYSVMTSVFSPVDQWFDDRFAPVKVTFTAQEWCGHVFQGIWPAPSFFQNRLLSYFASEGEKRETVKTAKGTVYEDALWIQLRELSGLFKQKKPWKGRLVTTLWSHRRTHVPVRPVSAEITRSAKQWEGKEVHEFVVVAGAHKRTFVVERAWPHRILQWSTSAGEKFRLQKTARLPYWNLSRPGDQRALQQLGLDVPR